MIRANDGPQGNMRKWTGKKRLTDLFLHVLAENSVLFLLKFEVFPRTLQVVTQALDFDIGRRAAGQQRRTNTKIRNGTGISELDV